MAKFLAEAGCLRPGALSGMPRPLQRKDQVTRHEQPDPLPCPFLACRQAEVPDPSTTLSTWLHSTRVVPFSSATCVCKKTKIDLRRLSFSSNSLSAHDTVGRDSRGPDRSPTNPPMVDPSSYYSRLLDVSCPLTCQMELGTAPIDACRRVEVRLFWRRIWRRSAGVGAAAKMCVTRQQLGAKMRWCCDLDRRRLAGCGGFVGKWKAPDLH